MTCGIYMIQNKVNGKIYIGQSVNIEGRWRQHKSELRGNDHENKHLQSAWEKYGQENFEFSILLECDESQLNTKEIDYITKLKTYDRDFGYNKTYGGDSGRRTEETKRRISDSRKGITFSEEHKKKLSKAQKGRIVSSETRNKLSKNNPRYWKGKSLSENAKKKISAACSIPIVQLSIDGKYIRSWKSSLDIEREGFNHGAVIQCCKNKYLREGNNIYKGYRWMYLSEYMDKYNGIID